jgi:hypothetical protein
MTGMSAKERGFEEFIGRTETTSFFEKASLHWMRRNVCREPVLAKPSF